MKNESIIAKEQIEKFDSKFAIIKYSILGNLIVKK